MGTHHSILVFNAARWGGVVATQPQGSEGVGGDGEVGVREPDEPGWEAGKSEGENGGSVEADKPIGEHRAVSADEDPGG